MNYFSNTIFHNNRVYLHHLIIRLCFFWFANLMCISCSSTGLLLEDKHESLTSSQQQCLLTATRLCVLQIAFDVASTMDNRVAQAGAFRSVAITHTKLGFVEQAFLTINKISIEVIQFQSFELLITIAQQQQNTQLEQNILQHAYNHTLQFTSEKQQLNALLFTAAIMLNSSQSSQAEALLQQIKQKIVGLSVPPDIQVSIILKLTEQLVKHQKYEWVEYFIGLQSNTTKQIYIRAMYTNFLMDTARPLAEQQFDTIKQQVTMLSSARDLRRILPPLIAVMVQIKDSTTVRHYALSLQNPLDQIKVLALLVEQLAKTGKILEAKQELILLLQKVRQQDRLTANKFSRNAMPSIYSDTASAIAEIVLALVKQGQLDKAQGLALQIRQEQKIIRGQTLTQLAIQQAKKGDVNTALLTMQSIQRPINRDSALAQIAGVVAHSTKPESLKRALQIAQAIHRPSWYDIALSEISAAQAKKGDSKAAIKTLSNIEHSYSLVYALCALAESIPP